MTARYRRTLRPGAASVHRMRGFTLIEVMVVVAIVAIIASIAYPSYRAQILKTKRAVAQSALLDVAARQEQYFLDNRAYTADLTNLGYSAATAYFIADRSQVAASSTGRIYAVSVQAATSACPIASCYVLQAAPQLGQADDTACGTLTLASDGTRSATGTTPSACW